ncbi:hypothetical protein P7K49_019537 [Saguinus oedipus]|uniref:Uncharacterized protein n=1 Tax=Saguinus oedipus TaxID=9490 RepID=A0ABQ9UXR3_SAGOE|nr:hypothetical protein P7K49_019537 [Saguinus oedipus]
MRSRDDSRDGSSVSYQFTVSLHQFTNQHPSASTPYQVSLVLLSSSSQWLSCCYKETGAYAVDKLCLTLPSVLHLEPPMYFTCGRGFWYDELPSRYPFLGWVCGLLR